MSWIELQIAVPPEIADLVAATVGEIAGGVEIRDRGTLIHSDEDRTVLVALCAPDDVEGLLTEVQETCSRASAAGLRAQPVTIKRRAAHEDEWRDIWKKYFKATRVGQTFIVRPSWDPGAVHDGDRVIDLDPGRAFGTGGHASTRMVIALAEQVEEKPVRRFLDLGCGSGILAIAGARLWPTAAGLAVDVDPEATACARENLERNRVTTVALADGTLADVPGTFDVVLANIQANVLLDLAPVFPGRLEPEAVVVLSGLLNTDAPAVLDSYQRLGFTLDGRMEEDEWVALRLGWRPAPRAER
ncbi:MAG TPA: 50S ribosomal protein L11 methyltransferase [Polyangia bacterium]|jgi:ribosomal protein L11 methyltransferase|nr:50S ribosomal protein L11 methyltransferase [Polyangia bacterium]